MIGRHRVVVVDDHGVVRHGLRALLDGHRDITVVGEAASAAEALERVEALHPDVVVMDVRLPGEDGISACARIRKRFPDTQVVMLSSFGEKEVVTGAVLAGARGYVLKNLADDHLVEAILRVAEGGWSLDPALAQSMMESVRSLATRESLSSAGTAIGPGIDHTQTSFGSLEELTPQERRILRLIAAGKTNREIGEELHISEKTARNYVSVLLGKLCLRNRAEAAAFAVRHGLGER